MTTPTIITIADETAAICKHVASVEGLNACYDYEPQQLGQTPVVTIHFAGIEPSEMANLRQSMQVRIYDVRLYVSLEGDWEGAQKLQRELTITLWERLLTLQRMGDTANVIMVHLEETKSEFTVDQQQRQYIAATIRLTTQHRSVYNP